ncbi:Mis12 protein-domain-containing protein [Massariosphaeria phaeospora]|uniref:Mis12 protein-domain-containing protein n=1 Tax=Massariosphaeria phaeospora TaxID=100035 RepID=A0A7C8IBY8_9PLEO|nr:Mis12 protein-domain-containing protein [Massariosphaeria phaeospora]
MANPKQQESMLLTEHFTWPPISLIDDIINAVNEVLYRCTDTFETGLSSANPALLGFADRAAAENRVPDADEDGNAVFPEAKLEIEEGILKLETLMENAIDKNFDKLEIWTLRNVLCLPREDGVGEWVRLRHYENVQTPPKDTHLTPEALYTLRRKLQETLKLHAALLAEKHRNDLQIAKLRALLQPTVSPKQEPRSSTSPAKPHSQNAHDAPFAFLTHTPAARDLGIQTLPTATSRSTSAATDPHPQTHTPLSTNTTFTTSQLPYLRTLLTSLQPHLATTALPTTRHEGEKAELAKERKVYIESQSKRILERRGVDTRDGVEGEFGGSRVGGDEVRALEGIVGALGSATGNGNGNGNGSGEAREVQTQVHAQGEEMDTT